METPSDYALTGALALALYFFLSYGVASPWYRSALGIVTFAYAASASLLLSLVVFGVVFGSRVDEPWRLAAGLAIFLALAGKISVLHYERHKGRLLRSTPTERKFTVSTTPTPSETPNVVIADPRVRKVATATIATAGIIIGAASALDLASPELDWSTFTGPAAAVTLFLAGVFGVSVTLPNVPKR